EIEAVIFPSLEPHPQSTVTADQIQRRCQLGVAAQRDPGSTRQALAWGQRGAVQPERAQHRWEHEEAVLKSLCGPETDNLAGLIEKDQIGGTIAPPLRK